MNEQFGIEIRVELKIWEIIAITLIAILLSGAIVIPIAVLGYHFSTR